MAAERERGRGWMGAPGLRVLVAAVLMLAAPGCSTVADPYRDAQIEAEIKARLVGEHGANLTRLGVVASAGTVYLSGAVPSAEQKTQAEALAKSVSGVRRVVNTLEVRPAQN